MPALAPCTESDAISSDEGSGHEPASRATVATWDETDTFLMAEADTSSLTRHVAARIHRMCVVHVVDIGIMPLQALARRLRIVVRSCGRLTRESMATAGAASPAKVIKVFVASSAIPPSLVGRLVHQTPSSLLGLTQTAVNPNQHFRLRSLGAHKRAGVTMETHSDSPPKRWELWRQDDNGNEFLIERFDTRDEAEAMAAKMEARGHKQIYMVRERPAAR